MRALAHSLAHWGTVERRRSERNEEYDVLIFGLGVKEILMATLVFVCETCGNNAAHQLIKRVRRFSLFFIPLFPLSTRYIDSCTACGRVIEVPGDQAEAAAQQAGLDLR